MFTFCCRFDVFSFLSFRKTVPLFDFLFGGTLSFTYRSRGVFSMLAVHYTCVLLQRYWDSSLQISFSLWAFKFCKSGKRRKAGAKCAVHKDENSFLLGSDLSSRRLCEDECHCHVYCHRLWCDLLCNNITQVQQARLLASRGCVRFARRPSLHWEKFQKSTHAHMCWSFDSTNPPYSYPVTRRVTRCHCTTCQVSSSQSVLFPYQALISICGISRVPMLSFQCHLDSHLSWLMTSFKVHEIPNLEWIGISCECVSSCDLLLVSLPLRVLCCCLLSRVRNGSPFLSVWLVRKSTQLTVHQEHTFLILHWTRKQFPVLDVRSSREIDQRNTVCKMCSSSSLDHQPSQRLNIPWCISRSCSSRLVSLQVSSGWDSVLVLLSNISTLSWHVSNLQV